MSQPTYLNLLTVEEFKTAAGTLGRSWTKVGVAFPCHRPAYRSHGVIGM